MRLIEKNDNKLQLDFKDHEPAIAKMRKVSALLSVNFEKSAIESDLSCDKNAKNMNQLILKAKSTIIRATKPSILKKNRFRFE